MWFPSDSTDPIKLRFLVEERTTFARCTARPDFYRSKFPSLILATASGALRFLGTRKKSVLRRPALVIVNPRFILFSRFTLGINARFGIDMGFPWSSRIA